MFCIPSHIKFRSTYLLKLSYYIKFLPPVELQAIVTSSQDAEKLDWSPKKEVEEGQMDEPLCRGDGKESSHGPSNDCSCKRIVHIKGKEKCGHLKVVMKEAIVSHPYWKKLQTYWRRRATPHQSLCRHEEVQGGGLNTDQ